MSAASATLLVLGLASWFVGSVYVKKCRRLYVARRGLEAESRWPTPAWQRRLFGAKAELLPPEARRLIIPSWVFIAAGALCIAVVIAQWI